jgi:hypothetical protein
MKTYNFTELKKIIKDQNYISAALEDESGKRILSFNNPKNKLIDKQLIDIEKRLNAEIFEDGIYTVLMAIAINKQKIADKYHIIKGEQKQDAKPQILEEKAANVLTWNAALDLHKELANLRAENETLRAENENLKDEICELEDNENSELSNPAANVNNFTTLLKEHAPTLIAIADKFFSLEEKKLEIKREELNIKNLHKPKPQTKTILPGTKEHLVLIEFYYKNNNEDKLNFELNKLFEVNPDLYDQVIKKMEEVKNV